MSEVLSPRAPGGHASRRAWRALSIVLIAVGALALLDAGVTLVWQEPFSALYAKFRQDHLSGTLRAAERATPTAGRTARAGEPARRAPPGRVPRERAAAPRAQRQRGRAGS